MPGELDTAATNLSEQTKKFQIALYYTYGDEEKAKQMVNGSYLDLYVIKGKFSSSSVYGAFILFINIPYLKLMHSYSIYSKSFEVSDIKTNQDWRNFEKDLINYSKKSGFDEGMTSKIKDAISKALTIQEITKFSKLIENDDGIAINHNFQKFISDVTGFQNVELSVDYDKISSIAMEVNSATSIKIRSAELTKDKKAEEEVKVEKIDDPLDGKEIKLMVNGAMILSPIKGKDISTLALGDRIMISVIDRNPKAIDLLKAFNAYDEEGNTKPIPGRIVSIKHDSVYKIFAIVAKGIYVKIVEEEDFIKVSMDPAFYNSKEAEEEVNTKKNKMTMIVLGIVFFILICIILYFVMIV
jgi:hypothetical protein